jgi:restriction endonuclease S subunit
MGCRKSLLIPKFLYYYLWAYKEEKLVSLMAGTANTSLTLKDLEAVTVVVPSMCYQSKFVSFMDRLVSLSQLLVNASTDTQKRAEDMLANPLFLLKSTENAAKRGAESCHAKVRLRLLVNRKIFSVT